MVALSAFIALSFADTSAKESDFPIPRIHGLSITGERWVVGGLRGLYIGQPGRDWKEVSKEAVKQVVNFGGATWVLYGSGSVDKLDVGKDQLFYDVLRDAAKRPWASCLSPQGKSLLIGGQGGWISKTADRFTETYPPDLKNQVVTAISESNQATWLGTQDGLYRYQSGKCVRFGLASDLSDLWVTAILPSPSGMFVATADGGLAQMAGSKFKKIETPTQKLVSLYRWNNRLVIGSLEGTWVRSGTFWTRLGSEETTFLGTKGGQLMVGTPTGVRYFKS